METQNIKDPEVRLLAGIAEMLKPQYLGETQPDPWASSPFGSIKRCPSRQVGKIGEQLVAGWCAAKGLDVIRSPDPEADRIIAGKRVEIKFSTLWRTGVYKFQQIRRQDYEYVICLGLSPFEAHCWVISKQLLNERVIGHTPQHGGLKGSDTYWISVDPSNPPDWLRGCGGTLRAAYEIIRKWQHAD